MRISTVMAAAVVLLSVAGCASAESATTESSRVADAAPASAPAAVPTVDPATLPPLARNGLPGERHLRLNALIGDWRVAKETRFAGAAEPVRGEVTARKAWIVGTGDRFIEDVSEGTFNGQPYYRMGVLGYSVMDQRYEWNTVDALNANMMTYKGEPGSGSSTEISMAGSFTDQGLLGDAYIGKTIEQRTVISIQSPDQHTLELYFTPPGEAEFLFDRAVYTRR